MDSDERRGNGSSNSFHESEGNVELLLLRYVDRINAGEKIDPAEVFADHPETAEEILQQLEAFQEIDFDFHPDQPLGTLGDYTLRRQIGRGGMGVVYEAWQGSMDRVVALKVLPPGVAADNKAFMRFMREAKTAGQLSHQNVVAVYSTGVEEGTPWYSMEFVEGETLAQVLVRINDLEPGAETPFGSKDEVAYFGNLAKAFAEVADGLQHAHSKGVVHRDIKPSNLILDADGRLRILDFGLARLEGQESLTLSGDVMGTPQYMSPEQARRRKTPVDHRTDIYSLGATLYELVTSKPPFKGKDHADTLSQIIERDPLPPKQSNARVPVDLETVVLKCLRKDTEDRYGTAEALAQDLRRFVRGDGVEARAEPKWEKLARRLRRQKTRLAFTAVLVLLVSAVALLFHFQRSLDDAHQDLEWFESIPGYDHALLLAAEQELEKGQYEKAVQSAGLFLDRHCKGEFEPCRRLAHLFSKASILAAGDLERADRAQRAREYRGRARQALHRAHQAGFGLGCFFHDPELEPLRRDPDSASLIEENSRGDCNMRLRYAAFHAWNKDYKKAVLMIEEEQRSTADSARFLPELEEYREALLPDLISYASIDAALETPFETPVPQGAEWKFYRRPESPTPELEWTELDFDTDSWGNGPSPFGYGVPDIGTALEDMERTQTLYVRHALQVSSPQNFQSFTLSVRSNNWFTAFLNGKEVGRGDTVFHRYPAVGFSEHISLKLEQFRQGKNVLALRVNRSRATDGFFLLPVLRGDLSPIRGPDPDRFAAFRRVATGKESLRRVLYLDGRLLQESGRFREAISEFEQLARPGDNLPEPAFRVAECLHALDGPARAEARVRDTLSSGIESRDLWELWFRLYFLELEHEPEDAARGFPPRSERGIGVTGFDYRWLLERLSAGDAIRINCGGFDYRDKSGALWSRDGWYVSGNRSGFTGDIVGTEDDSLYQTERWFSPGALQGYRVPLPPGEYRVALHFAEIVFRSGPPRTFGVFLENDLVLDEYEPRSSGFAHAERKTFDVRVADGVLNIDFQRGRQAGRQSPKISAVEIIRR